jgi:hypothetical protein
LPDRRSVNVALIFLVRFPRFLSVNPTIKTSDTPTPNILFPAATLRRRRFDNRGGTTTTLHRVFARFYSVRPRKYTPSIRPQHNPSARFRIRFDNVNRSLCTEWRKSFMTWPFCCETQCLKSHLRHPVLCYLYSIPLARAECDNSLPFSGASSIPLCYIYGVPKWKWDW